MKFAKYFILLLLIITVVLAIYLGTLDGKYDVSRTRSIKAAPEVIYNDIMIIRIGRTGVHGLKKTQLYRFNMNQIQLEKVLLTAGLLK